MNIEFGILEVGEKFIDPFSGMDFIKINPEEAKCLEETKEVLSFELEELVIVEN